MLPWPLLLLREISGVIFDKNIFFVSYVTVSTTVHHCQQNGTSCHKTVKKKLLVHCYFLIELLYFHVFRMSACLSLWKAFNSPSHKKNKNKNTVLRATRTKRTHFLIKASLHKPPLNRETVLKLFSVHTKLHRIFKAWHFHIIPIEYTIVRVQTCGSESFQK